MGEHKTRRKVEIRWHKLAHSDVYLLGDHQEYSERAHNRVQGIIKHHTRIEKPAIYYISPEVFNTYLKKSRAELLKDFYSLPSRQLPFPTVLIEWDELGDEGRAHNRICTLLKEGEIGNPDGTVTPAITGSAYVYLKIDRSVTCLFPLQVFVPLQQDDRDSADRVLMQFVPAPGISITDVPEHWVNLVYDNVLWAATMLFNCLQTRGFETEKPDHSSYNKMCQRLNKPGVPEYTILKIGHYYDREGNRHEYVPGKTPRLHWRRGHMRNQAHGPGLTLRKEIWIAPCLVNYVEGEEKPVLPTRVVVP